MRCVNRRRYQFNAVSTRKITLEESTMKSANACMWVLALLILSLPAVAGVEYDSSINYYQDGGYISVEADGTDDSHISYQSFSGGVGSGWSVTNGESFGLTSGHANAANRNMGVSAQVYSTPANSHFSDARISTEVSNRLTVSPGTSGLVEGDIATLAITIRLDGSLHGEATSWPGKGWSHAGMSAGLEVHDYAIQIDTGEGFWSPSQASFGASSEIEASDVSMPHWQYSYSADWSEYWRTQSNISSEDSYNNSWTTHETSESFHYQAGDHFDTGELTLLFEAIVGHTLDFDATLDLYVNANNDAIAWADFNNTFAFDVSSSVNGLNLDWEVVPEPATMMLLCLGGLFIRRKP